MKSQITGKHKFYNKTQCVKKLYLWVGAPGAAYLLLKILAVLLRTAVYLFINFLSLPKKAKPKRTGQSLFSLYWFV